MGRLKELHAKIGRLTMQNDFLALLGVASGNGYFSEGAILLYPMLRPPFIIIANDRLDFFAPDRLTQSSGT